jgi:hypothetical protein
MGAGFGVAVNYFEIMPDDWANAGHHLAARSGNSNERLFGGGSGEWLCSASCKMTRSCESSSRTGILKKVAIPISNLTHSELDEAGDLTIRMACDVTSDEMTWICSHFDPRSARQWINGLQKPRR